MAKIRISEAGWDMSDWPAEEITVGGIVMAAEGCGGDDDRAAVIDDDGRELTVLGVRRTPGRVEIVVHAPGAAETEDQQHPEQGQAEKRYPARQEPEAKTERSRPGSRPARRDLTAARARVNAVTDWIAAKEGSRQPDPETVDAAVSILAAPPNRRGVSVSVHPATVSRVGGHLVAVYRFGSRVGAVATAECSCPDNRVCEHLLVALAYEVPPVDSGRRTP
jgi:hypothetical protein